MHLQQRIRTASRLAAPRLRLVIAALLLPGLIPAAAGAQLNDCTFFLERSYMLFEPIDDDVLAAPDYYKNNSKPEDDELRFEARVAPHIFLVNTLDEELDTGGFALTFSFSPIFVVRQLRGFSQPLKNPSFMPKINLQLFWVSSPRRSSRLTWVTALQTTWGHHSNGGAGCLFVEESIVDGECVVSSPIPPEDRQVNPNGSFSTTYGRVELFVRGMRIEDGVSRYGVTVGGGVELNGADWPFLIFGGSASGDLRRIYGPTRGRATLEVDRAFSVAGVDLRATVGGLAEYLDYDKKPSPDATEWRWTAHLQLTKDTGYFRGLGLFARYFEGQDYYNLLFIRDIRRFQVGFSFDPTHHRFE